MEFNTYTDLFFKEGRFEAHEQWMKDNLIFEAVMGSQAYGLATPESDVDVVALVMNKEEHLWPQRYGYVVGFDTIPNFESKEIKGKEKRIYLPDGRDVEGEWNSLVRFFYLAGLKGSPNLIEILFVRRPMIKFGHKIAWNLIDNKHKFLSMRTFHAFKGYAFQQVARIRRAVERNEQNYRQAERLEKSLNLDRSYHIDEIKEEMEKRGLKI